MKIHGNTRHGKTKTRVHRTWAHMRQRCSNPSDSDYRLYGARGIEVCERWGEFENFYADMGEPPTRIHSLDRLDNLKGYYLENCRWATPKEQSNNTRRTIKCELFGVTKSLKQWSVIFKKPYTTVWVRYVKLKWTLDKTLNEPIRVRSRK